MIVTFSLNPCVDLTYEVSALPANASAGCEAEPLRAEAFHLRPGGKALNVSTCLALLGRASRTLLPSGGWAGGELLRMLGERAAFEVASIPIGGATRVNVVVSSADARRHLKVNAPGPPLSTQDLARIQEALNDAAAPGDLLVCGGSLPPGAPDDLYDVLLRSARTRGVLAALDAGGSALRLGLNARPEVMHCNRREFRDAFGEPLDDDDALLAAIRATLPGVGAAVRFVTDGPRAAFLVAPGLALRAVPPRIASGSACGAGDAALAGLLAGATEGGAPFHEALRNDNALHRGFQWALAAGSAAASTRDAELFGADGRLFEEMLRRVTAAETTTL